MPTTPNQAVVIPGSRNNPQTLNQVRNPYLPNVDPDTARELLTMRQQIQALQTQSTNNSGSTKGGDPLSKEQMEYIRKNLQAGGSHPLNVSGLLKGF